MRVYGSGCDQRPLHGHDVDLNCWFSCFLCSDYELMQLYDLCSVAAAAC